MKDLKNFRLKFERKQNYEAENANTTTKTPSEPPAWDKGSTYVNAYVDRFLAESPFWKKD